MLQLASPSKRGFVASMTPAAARGGRLNYRLSQYDSFTRKVLSGGRVNRSPRSPAKPRVPATPVDPWRPWLHTTNSVEPGRYSQRNTIFERNCLELNPPGWLVTAEIGRASCRERG